MASFKRSALLVLPGWDDPGLQQFNTIRDLLLPDNWVCRRGTIPDASWDGAERAKVSRADSLHHLLEDYMDLAAVRGVARRRFAVAGFSYGAYMATFLSLAQPVKLLVLRSPALYPDENWNCPKEDLDKRKLDDYRARRLGPSDNKALWCCSEYRGDVLLIDSECDEVIAPSVISSYERSLRRARSLTRVTLKDADHELSEVAWQQAYHATLVGWLNQRI